MNTVLAMALIGLALLGSGIASASEAAMEAGVEHAVPSGVWTGAYHVGELSGFVRVDLAASLTGDRRGVPEIPRLVRTDLVDIAMDGSKVRFGVPHTSGTLTFDGMRDDDVIQGRVEGAGEVGAFVLHREVPLELADYVPLLGSYRMHALFEDSAGGVAAERSRTILIMNGAAEHAHPGYFENDRFVAMFHFGNNVFMSELGEWLEFDPASEDEPLRFHSSDGNVYVGVSNVEYREELVEFAHGNVRLAGSLLIPAGDGPFPAVILIHGSQGDDRHPYRHYADHFAREGIAALIYDKRGTGGSTGNWRSAGIDALTADALAAANFLRLHPKIDPHAIGVWGISQGGWIVALAAQRDPDIAFVIGVSAAGATPGRQEAYRIRNVLVDQGLRGIRLELTLLWHRLLYPLGHLATKPYIPLPTSVKKMAGGLAVSPFFNPVPVWRQVRQPVLLLYGEADTIVDPVESPVLITAALEQGGHAPPTVLTFDAADHSIRVTETGRPSEVLKELRFAPGYFEAKSDWIWGVVGRTDGK